MSARLVTNSAGKLEAGAFLDTLPVYRYRPELLTRTKNR